MPQVTKSATLAFAFLLALGGCSESENPMSPATEDDESARDAAHPISSPGQPLANNLARAVALAMNNPDVRLSVRDAMRDSPFHEHKIHLRSFLEERAGEALRGSIAVALNTSAANVSRVLENLPDMEFYLPEKEHRVQWTGGSDYFVMAVESPDDFQNPLVVLYDSAGKRAVVDVVNAMPEEAVFAMLPVEADFSRPDVPARAYKGEAVQSSAECHPLEVGCTSDGSRSTDFVASLAAITDTTGYLYRFWLPRDRDGLGSNEIEMWYWMEGSSEDPGTYMYADDSGAPCIRFTGIDAGKWYEVNRSLGDYHPRGGTDLGTEFWEDDVDGCDLWLGPSSDDWVGRTKTSWSQLYPSVAYQDVWYLQNGDTIVDGYASFKAPVNYLLSATMSGPVFLAQGESGTWTVSVSNGVGPYSYRWYKDSGLVGTGQSYQTTMGSESFTLQVTVTDQGTGATDSDSRSVYPESGCSDPSQIIC